MGIVCMHAMFFVNEFTGKPMVVSFIYVYQDRQKDAGVTL